MSEVDDWVRAGSADEQVALDDEVVMIIDRGPVELPSENESVARTGLQATRSKVCPPLIP